MYCGKCGRENNITTEHHKFEIDGKDIKIIYYQRCECGEPLGVMHSCAVVDYDYLTKEETERLLQNCERRRIK